MPESRFYYLWAVSQRWFYLYELKNCFMLFHCYSPLSEFSPLLLSFENNNSGWSSWVLKATTWRWYLSRAFSNNLIFSSLGLIDCCLSSAGKHAICPPAAPCASLQNILVLSCSSTHLTQVRLLVSPAGKGMSFLQSVCHVKVLWGSSSEVVLFSLAQLHMLSQMVTTSF